MVSGFGIEVKGEGSIPLLFHFLNGALTSPVFSSSCSCIALWMLKALLGEFSNGCTKDMYVIEGYHSCNHVQLTGRDHLFSNSLASRAVATIAS